MQLVDSLLGPSVHGSIFLLNVFVLEVPSGLAIIIGRHAVLRVFACKKTILLRQFTQWKHARVELKLDGVPLFESVDELFL